MAYQEPPFFLYEEEPDPADIQILADNTDELATTLANAFNPATSPKSGGSHPVYTFSHQAGWLAYQSETADATGTIIGQREEEQYGTEVRLPYVAEPDVGYFDLSSVPWLVQGKIYCVVEVRFAQEVDY